MTQETRVYYAFIDVAGIISLAGLYAKADAGKQRFLGIAKKKQAEFDAALAQRAAAITASKEEIQQLKALLLELNEATDKAEAGPYTTNYFSYASAVTRASLSYEVG